ncbi:MAG: murein L,D-transpeptidase catalytic domain-containing protein [Parvularculaceae bacterium]
MAAIVDFAAPSWRPRLHIVDLTTSRVRSFLTAHGRGSDPSHTGWLSGFSNAIGSNATSRGAYRTAGRYDGKYGRSMRLVGLDAENSNAEPRAIVIHPAWYVGDKMIERFGKLGRSEGCFAVAESDHLEILDRLGSGALFYAGRL